MLKTLELPRDDCGAGFVPTARPAERESGGRGLEMVAKLTDRWGVREGPTQVWFELSDRAA